MSENEDLHAKIGVLAGRINRHKAQTSPRQNGPLSFNSRGSGYPSRGSYRSSYRARGGFRNRTLITHGISTSSVALDSPVLQESPNGMTKTEGSAMTWYRPEVLQKENRLRSEERKRKAKDFQDRERAQVQQFAKPRQQTSVAPLNSPAAYQISVDGVLFTLSNGYNKLVRPLVTSDKILTLAGSEVAASATPKQFEVNGVQFKRTKNGNLVRANAIEKRFVRQTMTRILQYKGLTEAQACKQIEERVVQTLHLDWYHFPQCHQSLAKFHSDARGEVFALRETDALASTTARRRLCALIFFVPVNARPEMAVTSPMSCHRRARQPVAISSVGDVQTRSAAMLTFQSNPQPRSVGHLLLWDTARKAQIAQIDIFANALTMPTLVAMRQAKANKADKITNSGVDEDDVSSDEDTHNEIDSDDADSDDLFEPEEVFGFHDGENLGQQDYIKVS
ncbi:MAG: hypothetical protein Q9227_003592 [Pyrenula ochraceoflavens]